MSESVAKRYAGAVYELAQAADSVDAYEEELKLIVETVDNHKDLSQVLSHPRISDSDKKALVEDIFKDAADRNVINLLKLLIDRGRTNILKDIKDAYVTQANAERGIIDMKVTTAEALDEETKQDLISQFSAKTGKRLRLDATVDKSLIGGIVVRIGNRIFDGSMAGKLERFKQELKA